MKRLIRQSFSALLSFALACQLYPAALASSPDVPITEDMFPDAIFRQWLTDPANLDGAGADSVFTQEELEAAKRSLIATYCSILDVPSQLEDFQFGQNLAGLTFGPDELAEIIRVIDAQQVVEAAQRIQLDTTYFLMGPEGGEGDAQ